MNRKQWTRVGWEAKRWLFITHRWIGITICLVIALWFATGIVMVYVGYPALTVAERYSHLPALRADNCCVPLSKAWQALPSDFDVTSLKLTRIGSRQVFTFTGPAGHPVVIDAATGERIKSISKSDALNSAANFSPGARLEYRGLVSSDLWLHGHHLDHHFPVHRIQTDDAAGNLLFVSSVTGEVVRDASLVERRWNFVGAWLHWIYAVRDSDAVWRGLLIVLSFISFALLLTGTVAGILQWKFRGSYANGSRTPYRQFYLRWHHITGMMFALIAFTWVFSGFMSINPFKLMRTDAPPLNLSGYAGGALTPQRFELEPLHLLTRLPPAFEARELEWRMVGGNAFLIAYNQNGEVRIMSASGTLATAGLQLPEAQLAAAASELIPGRSVAAARLLHEYDFYYYKRASHTLSGDRERPLPVFRIDFEDPDRSIVYIDPRSGKILSHYNRADKQVRWMFRLLHSWDLPGLLSVRPLWDIIVLSLLGGGFLLSLTGVVIGWRRLRLSFERVAS